MSMAWASFERDLEQAPREGDVLIHENSYFHWKFYESEADLAPNQVVGDVFGTLYLCCRDLRDHLPNGTMVDTWLKMGEEDWRLFDVDQYLATGGTFLE